MAIKVKKLKGTIILGTRNDIDYDLLLNKPQINGVELIGNKNLEDLGIINYDDTDITNQINIINEDLGTVQTDIQTISNDIDTINADIQDIDSSLNHLDDVKANANETYTKDQVDDLIGTIENVRIEVVEDLPEIGSTNVIYFVHRPDPEFDDIFNEYVWENNQYELIGNTLIDLSDYVTKNDLSTELNNYYNKEQVDNNLMGLATTASLIAGINSCEPKMPNGYDYVIQSVLYGGGESGYRKYKNGTLEQWGVATTQANETEFTMHQPHIDQNFSIFIEPREQGNFFHYAMPSGLQKFKTRITASNGTVTALKIQWRSWGRWK